MRFGGDDRLTHLLPLLPVKVSDVSFTLLPLNRNAVDYSLTKDRVHLQEQQISDFFGEKILPVTLMKGNSNRKRIYIIEELMLRVDI